MMRSFLTRMRNDELVRSNAVFFAGSMLVAVLNYLYHPVLSRIMPVEEFGEAQAIFSLSLGIGVILNVLGMVALNIASNRDVEPEREEVIADLQSLALYAMVAVSILLVLWRGKLSESLSFESPVPFVVLAAILLTNTAFTFRRFYLQAHRRFAEVSAGNAIVAAGRVAIATGLVLLGFGTFGATGALVVAQLIALGYVAAKTRGARALKPKLVPSVSRKLAPELAYALVTLFALGFVTFITTADVVFAKYYFEPETAGLYSGLSTVARIVYFSTASTAGVLLPSVRIGSGFAANRKILFKSFLLLIAIGGTALAFIYAAPGMILGAMIGEKFAALSPLLPKLALVSFLASALNLIAYFFLALRSYALIPITAAAAIVTAAFIAQNHAEPRDIVDGFLYGSITALVFLIGLFMWHWYKNEQA